MKDDMTAPTGVINENNSEILDTSSQLNVSLTRSSNTRSNPDSTDTLPATQMQTLRQIRRRKYVGDLHNLGTKINITDKVIDALGSPDVLNKIIPILS